MKAFVICILMSASLAVGASPLIGQTATEALVSKYSGTTTESPRKLPKNELKALISSAKTPDEHQRLAAYFRSEAESLTAKQQEHDEDAAEYYRDPSRHPLPKFPTFGEQSRQLADHDGMAAQKALSLAALHEKLAQEGK